MLRPIYNVMVLNFPGGRAKVVDDPDVITWSQKFHVRGSFLENRPLRESIERMERRAVRESIERTEMRATRGC